MPDESLESMVLLFITRLPKLIVVAEPKALTVDAVVFNKLNVVLSVVISPPRTIRSPSISVSAVTTKSPVPFGLRLISALDTLPSMLF